MLCALAAILVLMCLKSILLSVLLPIQNVIPRYFLVIHYQSWIKSRTIFQYLSTDVK
uniref:Uncharacterized protein n=1 Tax=Glossina morsitans morsitans TaxID=37546 RepID=A0A1B0GFV9_GLOMM